MSERLSAEERRSLHQFAGDWAGFYAAVERILAAHLADVESRLAAAWGEGWNARARGEFWQTNPYRAALHPDPSEAKA